MISCGRSVLNEPIKYKLPSGNKHKKIHRIRIEFHIDRGGIAPVPQVNWQDGNQAAETGDTLKTVVPKTINTVLCIIFVAQQTNVIGAGSSTNFQI